MKKILSVLLSFVIVLSFAACSKKSQTISIPSELADLWKVAAIYYSNNLISLDDSEVLNDLYDSKWLTINEDGTFCYLDFINYNGVVQSTNEKNTYILKTNNVTKFETENGHLKEVQDTQNDPKDYVITVLSDNTDTILLNTYDGENLHPEINDSTFVFSKEGVTTDYINQNKAHLNSDSNAESTTIGSTSYDYSSYTTTANYATSGERNALEKAYDYLEFSAFSYTGLIEQLEYEGFSKSEAEYAVDNCGANWNEQAVRKAKEYLDYSSFSRSELIEQLKFEGFTDSQATYGVNVAY